MEQQAYVDEQGQVVEPKDNKKKIVFIGVAIALILLVIGIVLIVRNVNKNKECDDLEKKLKEAALSYAEDKKLLPTTLSPNISLTVEQLVKDGYLKDFIIGETSCSGDVKITKVKDDYIVTLNLENCERCSTDSRYGDWSEWSEKNSNKNIIDVEVKYNYVKKTVNYTDWTNYYRPSELEEKPFTSVNDNRFKTDISKDAKNVEMVSEGLTYYRYRDKQWKFYRNNKADYSDFSSTQPKGYSTKDGNASITTEWSDWSINYPDAYSYRKIEEKTGYRWYYKDGDELIYYNNGQYLPDAPDSKYTERDKKDTATVFRYQDTLWRWYNGEARGYSYFMSLPTQTYKYKDEAITSYSKYSIWKTESSLTVDNKSYREEEQEVRTRYRLKYDMHSYELLTEYLSKEQFEKTVGMTLEEVDNDNGYELLITYKYRYRK